MAFIVDYAKDWALDTASGYLKTGIQAGGTLAGNAVGGVGSTLENGGRAFGEGSKPHCFFFFFFFFFPCLLLVLLAGFTSWLEGRWKVLR